jgi:UDP-glucose 4-epimerase
MVGRATLCKGRPVKNILITGIAGYLGTILAKRLDAEPEIERIVGVDVKKPSFTSSKLTFIQHDVRQPFGQMLTTHSIDTAIHLAFVVVPTYDEKRNREINIEGSKNFLRACAISKVTQVFYQGSHTEYGAFKGNPALFTEESPLRPNKDYPYPSEKTEVDLLFQQYAKDHPDACVTIGRTVAVTGACGDGCGLTALFLPVMVRALGKDPLWQFIHEDDWAEMVTRLLRGKKGGAYNLAAAGGLTYKQMIKKLGKPSLALPSWVVYGGIKLSWALRLQERSQAGGLHMLEYPINISNEKVTKATGYTPRYSGEQAFEMFLRSRAQ